MNNSLHGLYGITDQQLMPDLHTLLEKVELSLLGGTRIIQYRDKSDDSRKRQQQALALAELCHSYQVPLLINDDIRLAAECGAQGVHLGQSDGSITEARALLGNNCIIGVTCHSSLELARSARQQGADYIAFGAFFPSRSKPGAKPAPLNLLQQARKEFDLPIVAIGGISVDNARQVIDACADMTAVIHALYAAEDIQSTARQFSRLFPEPTER